MNLGGREEELFLRGDVEPWAMALLGLGKEGGGTTRPSERSVMSVWMSVGAVPAGPCGASLCAAVISLSLMSVGVTALMAECKSYIRNWEIKREVEFFL